MTIEESIYVPLGYCIIYEVRNKYKGHPYPLVELCRAEKDGERFYVFRDPGWYAEIMQIQSAIPHMAHFAEPACGHILMEAVSGQQMWHMNVVRNIRKIQKQLLEFSRAAKSQNFFHGDIRPWNIFLDNRSQITVIDWNLGGPLVEHKGHLDLEDARRVIKLLKGEMDFQDAWGWNPSFYPDWCKHKIKLIDLA